MKTVFVGLICCVFHAFLVIHAEARDLKIALLTAEKGNYSKGEAADEILGATTAAFFESKRFQVVERDQLSKIFAERDLTDLVNGSPGDLSNLNGVDMIGLVTWSTEQFRDQDGSERQHIYIDVRLTDVKSGTIVGSVSSRRTSMLISPTSIHNASRLLLENVREMFPPEGSVLKVDGKEVVVSLGNSEGIKKDDVLEVIQDGEILFDAEGRAYPPMTEIVATLKVSQADQQLSRCKLKSGKVELGAKVRLKGNDQRVQEWMQRILPIAARAVITAGSKQ